MLVPGVQKKRFSGFVYEKKKSRNLGISSETTRESRVRRPFVVSLFHGSFLGFPDAFGSHPGSGDVFGASCGTWGCLGLQE